MSLGRSSVFLGICALFAACGGESTSSDGAACVSDGDCKGDRVCNAGACEERPTGNADDGDGTTSASASTSTTSTSATSTVASTNTATAQGSTASGDPSGPIFLTIGTNVSKLTPGYEFGHQTNPEVTFTAVLTDPDGVDDLIGGTLKDGSGPPYGAFATTGQEGAYEITLSWDEINLVASINHDLSGNEQRTFVAEFFDVAGHRTESLVTLTLQCGSATCDGVCGYVRCDGSCRDIDQACGSCDANCGDNLSNVCYPFGAEWHCNFEGNEYTCHDGFDNDGDGLTDCDDFGFYNCDNFCP